MISSDKLKKLLASADPIESALIRCTGKPAAVLVPERARVFDQIVQALPRDQQTRELEILWTRYLPLAQWLVSRLTNKSTTVVGLTGLPGVGKTFLTSVLVTAVENLIGAAAAVVSLDDFYLNPEERQRRGFRFRAAPGTHNFELLNSFIHELRSDSPVLTIPRYNTNIEQRLGSVTVTRPRLLLFEGWFVGARVEGYELLADVLDQLVYIDLDLRLARQCRLDREARIREESDNALGMSPVETEQFWNEAILPTASNWTLPLKETADLVIEVDAEHRFTNVTCR